MFSRGMPARAAMSSERVKIGGDVLHDVDAGIGAIAVMHDDDGCLARGEQAGHAVVALQAPDVVGDHGALVQRPGDDLGLHAVDGDGDAERDDIGEAPAASRRSSMSTETGCAPP